MDRRALVMPAHPARQGLGARPLRGRRPIPAAEKAGAITKEDWTRFDSVGNTDAPCALGLGGPVFPRDGEERKRNADHGHA